MSSTTASSGELAGRTALISGASRGIGRECARALAAAGAQLLLLGRDVQAMTLLLKDLGGPGSAFSIDFSHPDVVGTALQKVRAHLRGAPDIIVNNAGQFMLASIERTETDEFERTLTVNLTSQFIVIREFLSDMRARGSGDIVTIGSIADHQAFPENAAYAASKFGTRGLHQVLREELRGSGVRATLISPGPTDTSLWDHVKPEARPGLTPRSQMLNAAAVGDAVRFVVTRPADVNIDELRLTHA